MFFFSVKYFIGDGKQFITIGSKLCYWHLNKKWGYVRSSCLVVYHYIIIHNNSYVLVYIHITLDLVLKFSAGEILKFRLNGVFFDQFHLFSRYDGRTNLVEKCHCILIANFFFSHNFQLEFMFTLLKTFMTKRKYLTMSPNSFLSFNIQ